MNDNRKPIALTVQPVGDMVVIAMNRRDAIFTATRDEAREIARELLAVANRRDFEPEPPLVAGFGTQGSVEKLAPQRSEKFRLFISTNYDEALAERTREVFHMLLKKHGLDQ